jgi:hypothetical protein
LWVVAGVLVGLGLLNKDLVPVLALALTLGMLTVSGGRSLVPQPLVRPRCGDRRSRLGPGLIWQAQHGWPQVTLARMIRDEYGTAEERIGSLVLQVVLFSLGASVLWVIGAVCAWREPRWRFARVLAVSWLVALIVFVVTAGQGYYTVGVYPALIAAGCVVVERRPRLYWAMAVVVAVTSAGRDAGLAADPAAADAGRIRLGRPRRATT